MRVAVVGVSHVSRQLRDIFTTWNFGELVNCNFCNAHSGPSVVRNPLGVMLINWPLFAISMVYS